MSTSVSGDAQRQTRALLRAHLSAAAGHGHLTRHCPICHRLLRLAMRSTSEPQSTDTRS
ncbi:DUF6274 family protein [Streptantibioticus rubrisoli]|uniref:DUF6274 family protein n=1 Tax=Streptantibioticus rubrisoli TaxID=1387313 RepID=A0ABT1PFF0_9ACTN|nr:DUF6274 family protein [Streptantibioticus rubrisoli]MCQ4044095.1 DUF6274 family protein [Streptantibioticus rubrisoli]